MTTSKSLILLTSLSVYHFLLLRIDGFCEILPWNSEGDEDVTLGDDSKDLDDDDEESNDEDEDEAEPEASSEAQWVQSWSIARFDRKVIDHITFKSGSIPFLPNSLSPCFVARYLPAPDNSLAIYIQEEKEYCFVVFFSAVKPLKRNYVILVFLQRLFMSFCLLIKSRVWSLSASCIYSVRVFPVKCE